MEKSRNDKNVARDIIDNKSSISVEDYDSNSKYILLSTCDGKEKNKRNTILAKLL